MDGGEYSGGEAWGEESMAEKVVGAGGGDLSRIAEEVFEALEKMRKLSRRYLGRQGARYL